MTHRDLDLACTMQAMEIVPGRLEGLRAVFPFQLSDDEAWRIGVKACAKWSLGSNAGQHQKVFDLLLEELEAETGRFSSNDELNHTVAAQLAG